MKCGGVVELGGVIIRSQGFGSGFAIYATDAAARVFSKFVELIAKSPELAPQSPHEWRQMSAHKKRQHACEN